MKKIRMLNTPFSVLKRLSNGKLNVELVDDVVGWWWGWWWGLGTVNLALLALIPNNCANSNWLIHFKI